MNYLEILLSLLKETSKTTSSVWKAISRSKYLRKRRILRLITLKCFSFGQV